MLNALFLDALRREFAICVPPDYALEGRPLDRDTMRAHVLEPHGAFRDRYFANNALPPKVAEAATPRSRVAAFFRSKRDGGQSPRAQTPRSQASGGEPAEPVADNEVERVDDPYPHLLCTGPAWPEGPVRARILGEDEIKTGDGSAHVFVLDRSIAAWADPAHAEVPPAVLFGDSAEDNVMTATDALDKLDIDGTLLTALNKELQAFRERYEPLQGYEEDLFKRVESIAKTQARRWVGSLGSNCLSMRRAQRAASLAVNSYVHGRLYQFVFPAMCAIEASASAEFEVGAEAIQQSAKRLQDFDVPEGIATRLSLGSLQPLFNRFNVATTPFDKMQVSSSIITAITALITHAAGGNEGVSADLLVPVLALSLATFPPRDMAAQVAYTERFLPREATAGADEARSYALVSFRAALEYIRRYSDEDAVQRRLSDVS